MKEITIYIILLSFITIHAGEFGDARVAGTCYLTGYNSIEEYDANDFVGVLNFELDFEDYTINVTGSLACNHNGMYDLTLHKVILLIEITHH